jgi:hypothetical protein
MVLRWLPSGGMLLGGFVMATFDKFVIFKCIKTLRASTQLVEREQGQALEIEKNVRNSMTDTVHHPSLKVEVTLFLFFLGVSQLLFRDNILMLTKEYIYRAYWR